MRTSRGTKSTGNLDNNKVSGSQEKVENLDYSTTDSLDDLDIDSLLGELTGKNATGLQNERRSIQGTTTPKGQPVKGSSSEKSSSSMGKGKQSGRSQEIKTSPKVSSKGTKETNSKAVTPGKEKLKPNREFALPRPSAGRIVGTVFFGMVFSAVLAGICYRGYMNYIKYPNEVAVTDESTGIYCLENWENSVASLEGTGSGSYLQLEIEYANDNENKLEFYRKMTSTVSYEPYYVVDRNIYGNPLVDENDQLQYRLSTVGEGEYVKMSYIDYDQVEIDRNVVNILMDEADLRVGDVDYPNKLVDVFCQYMNSLSDDELPLKTVRRIPYMVKVGDSYQMDEDEDIYLDRLLFSSDSLYRLMDRFSAVASAIGVNNPEWDSWNALPDDQKAGIPEPSRELESISPTEEWLEWDALPTAQKSIRGVVEPEKYNWKEVMDKTWCGSFYLQNEYTTVDENGDTVRKEISAEIGDGTFEDPAGLNTDIVTTVFVTELENGETVTNQYPISIRMVEYGVSEDAIHWFEDQDDRNRGIDVSSEVQYAYYVFEVTNLSDRELTINDNSSLCDSNANVTSRTGTMYGLQSSVTLQPDETGVIETWGRSTELNKRYLIWGADFARRVEPVWFRVLAGDIDDPSENKGVTINNTRQEEEETPTPTPEVSSSSSED